MVSILHPTEANAQETSWKVEWPQMRNSLTLITKTLSLHWGYSAVVPFTKTQAYNTYMTSLIARPHHCGSHMLTAIDLRNLNSKQMFLKPRLTPLANVEKVNFSGFDTRLVSLKSPKRLKSLRKKLTPCLASQTTSYTANTAFVGSGLGWGRKSRLSLNFLTHRPIKTFKKKHAQTSLSRHQVYPSLFISYLKDFDNMPLDATNELNMPITFLQSLELTQASSSTQAQAFFEFAGETPNLSPSTNANTPMGTPLIEEALTHLTWLVGLSAQNQRALYAHVKCLPTQLRVTFYQRVVFN